MTRPGSEELILSDHLRRHLPAQFTFDAVLALDGIVHRVHKNRRTIETTIGGRRFFVKTHRETALAELLKNILRGRRPILSARTEWRAASKLRELGVLTVNPAGYGRRGRGPLHLHSFIITEALDDMISLDQLARDWNGLSGVARTRLQRRLLRDIARLARTMHEAGLCHRDFYLAHFLLPRRDFTAWTALEPLNLHVIDLHRVRISARPTSMGDRVRDLSALLYSCMPLGLSRREWIRFMEAYRGLGRREAAADRDRLGRRVIARTIRIHRGDHGTRPRLPGDSSSSA